jgi:two-component system, NarL family, response regulator YdfI
MTRVLIAALSGLLRRGFEASIPPDAPIEIVASVDLESGDLERAIEEQHPDVVVLEHRGGDTPLGMLSASEAEGGPAIVLLADSLTGAFAREAIHAGARAVISRDSSAEEIVAAISAAAAGLVIVDAAVFDAAVGVPVPANGVAGSVRGVGDASVATALSPREIEVLRMMAEGLGNKEIAWRLKISEHTVKYHISSIFTKLDVSSRTEAVTLGVRLGMVPL